MIHNEALRNLAICLEMRMSVQPVMFLKLFDNVLFQSFKYVTQNTSRAVATYNGSASKTPEPEPERVNAVAVAAPTFFQRLFSYSYYQGVTNVPKTQAPVVTQAPSLSVTRPQLAVFFRQLIAVFTPIAPEPGTNGQVYQTHSQLFGNINERARGSNGVIYNSFYGDDFETITKMPLLSADEAVYAPNILTAFFRENLIHLLLLCFHETWSRLVGSEGQLPAFMPEIKMLCQIIHEGTATPCVIMQKMKGSGEAFCNSMVSGAGGVPHGYFHILDMISQIAYALYVLQKYAGFMHRDLHYQNVMFDRRSHPQTMRFEIAGEESPRSDGVAFTIPNSENHWYLIDFGLSCIQFSGIEGMPQAALTLAYDSTNFYSVNQPSVIACNNKGYDLCVFLKSIQLWARQPHVRSKFPALNVYLNTKFSRQQGPSRVNDPLDTIYEAYRLLFPEFEPLQILRDMAELVNDANQAVLASKQMQHTEQPAKRRRFAHGASSCVSKKKLLNKAHRRRKSARTRCAQQIIPPCPSLI